LPGSWEILAQRQVLCGILHTEVVSMAWALGFRNLIIPGDVMPVAGMPFSHARNEICKNSLLGGYKYAFHLDSDVIPPRDAILRLMAHNLPIVSGLYARRSPPHGVPVMLRGGQWLQEYQPNALNEVDWVGAGCLLLRRDLLENCRPTRMSENRRWFDWRANFRDNMELLPKDGTGPLSEDFVFCDSLRRQGIKIFVDTSIVCRHCGLAQATPGKYEPLETTTNT
jgi:hypothetical protein